MTTSRHSTPTYVRARHPQPRVVVEVKPDSTTKKVAKVAGKVALYTVANIVANPIRLAQGMPPMLVRPLTAAEQAALRTEMRTYRRARDRQFVIDRHLAGKRQLPTSDHKLRAYQAATGSLPQWFIDATGSTELH